MGPHLVDELLCLTLACKEVNVLVSEQGPLRTAERDHVAKSSCASPSPAGQEVKVLVGEPVAVADLLATARAEGWGDNQLAVAVTEPAFCPHGVLASVVVAVSAVGSSIVMLTDTAQPA